MKICFYRHSLLSRGGDKMVVEYANYLALQGHDVVIMTNTINTVFKVQARIEKISKLRYKVNTIFNAVFLKKNYDIIIADIIVMVAFLAFRNKKRIICFGQDYDESYYKNLFMKMLVRAVYFISLTILKIPVIAVSEELGRLLRTRFNAHVTVIKNGVDMALFFPDKDAQYLSLKGDSKVILVFARSDYRKGFDIAIEVLLQLNKEIMAGSISVWAVGEKIDVPFHMRNFGYVSQETLRKILSCSDVLLYPSRHEGLPLFVLEAIACGCAVVTTEVVNILTNNEDGFVCKAEDVDCLCHSLIKVLNNSSLKESIASKGYITANKYSLDESKKQFIDSIAHFED